MTFPPITQQTVGEPLANPWYTPGWTSQNPIYQVIPSNPFSIPGFPPSGAVYITLTGNFFDEDGNPIAGNLTFFPSSPIQLTSTVNGVTVVTIIPQRNVGQSLFDTAGSFWGSGKIYLKNGVLSVSLLATDNVAVNMVPTNFTYHVTESWLGGRSYDILVPSTSTNPVDINSLIVPGSLSTVELQEPDDELQEENVVEIAATSTEFLSVNVTATIGGATFNPTSDVVQFAFVAGPTEPTNAGPWYTGSWVSTNQPYTAQILIGPANGGLVLPAGQYMIWVKVVATPQVPVFQAGTLIIF